MIVFLYVKYTHITIITFRQFHRLLNPEIWPTNVEVGRFRFPRDRDNIDRPRY